MARERGSSVLNINAGYGSCLPSKLPDAVKKMIVIASKIQKDFFRKCLQVILQDLEGRSVSEDGYGELFESSKLSEEQFTSLYAGLLMLLRYALRHPRGSLKKEAFILELSDLQFPKDFLEDVMSIVFSDRQMIEEAQLKSRAHLPTVQSLKWRIDVAISTSALSRVLEPTVLVELKDSCGKVSTFEVTQSKFHELRYNIAFLLKEMEDVEKRGILKVQD